MAQFNRSSLLDKTTLSDADACMISHVSLRQQSKRQCVSMSWFTTIPRVVNISANCVVNIYGCFAFVTACR